MHKLQLRGQLLYLTGSKQTLSLAEKHNTRKIPIELETFGHINPSKIQMNQEIVSLQGMHLEEAVLQYINQAGIDINKGPLKRRDKGLAIEWVFTVTPGFECNFMALYKECLGWLQIQFPACPIAHAIVHFDEDDPHLHVIMVPIEGQKMPSSRILGYKGSSRSRLNDLYEKVGSRYGLSFPLNLKGAAKRMASETAIKACENLSYRKALGVLWNPLVSAIKSRPEPFLEALRIEPPSQWNIG